MKTALILLFSLASPFCGNVSAQTALTQLRDAAPTAALQSMSVPQAVQSDADEAQSSDEAGATRARGHVTGIGISHSGNPFDTPNFSASEIASMIKKAGGNFYRPHIPLNMVLPEVSAADMKRLKKATSDYALLDSMTDELAHGNQWEKIDGLVDAFSKQGINLILVVGAGYRKEAPLYHNASGETKTVSPTDIGLDNYLTLMRWLVGATVRRYGDRVQYWQVENEINVAFMTFVTSNWRTGDTAWADHTFLNSLLRTLSTTVHAEGRKQGRQFKTTHNFATDGLFNGWHDLTASTQWHGFAESKNDQGDLDIIGIDIYPNYI